MSTALRPRSRNGTLSTRVSYVANSPPLYHFKQHWGMLTHLPEDILLDILRYLEVQDVLTLRKVSVASSHDVSRDCSRRARSPLSLVDLSRPAYLRRE